MDEQRIEAYLNLINTLLLNRESEAELNKILNDNQELIDSGLWQTMFQVAEQLAEGGNQDNAEFLLEMANYLASQDYIDFLIEILQATGESEGDSKVVYPLLQQNLDKLDNNFADILQDWATAKFSQVEADVAEDIAYIISDFSYLINNFPLGNKANNMEIVIAGYELISTVFTRNSHPENWAGTQYNLGLAYSDRITGDKAENIESAIAAYQNALLVRTKKDFPIDWAMTQNNLGTAYSDRITGDKAENIESAIAAYQNALLVRTKKDFPIDWAMTQNNLGTAYSDRITGDKAENLESAIAAYQNALLVRTQKDFPIDWAGTQNNLGNAYRDRITGDKAENIESAIAAYQNALQVRTLEANLLDHLQTTRNLGNLYFDNRDWQLATDNYEKAITAVELSRSWATTEERRQEIIGENIDIYDKAILAYIYIDRRDKALEIAERSQARNLVELLTNRNLLPQSDVPPEVMQQFQQRQTEIRIGKGELEKVRQKLSGQDVQQRPSLEESEKRLNDKLQELGQQLETVFNQIQKFDPTFRLTQEVQPITFAEIQQLATDEQTAFIEWYIMAEKFVTFVILPPT